MKRILIEINGNDEAMMASALMQSIFMTIKEGEMEDMAIKLETLPEGKELRLPHFLSSEGGK